MESEIGGNSTQENAVSSYFELCGTCSSLEKSCCVNLKHFALSLKNQWSSRLREKLSRYTFLCVCVCVCMCVCTHTCMRERERGRERWLYLIIYSDFSSVLSEIKWPFVSSAVSSNQTEIWRKHEKKFTKLFGLLVKLDEKNSSGSPLEGFRKTNLGEPIILPLELLLAPLRKRFKYHFSGDKKTNSKEKVWCNSHGFIWRLSMLTHVMFIAFEIVCSQNGTLLKCLVG